MTQHLKGCTLMEKKRPTYDLGSIKEAFYDSDNIDITRTALRSANELGFVNEDIIMVIQAITNKDFIKSMTSHADHKIWQDVYNVSWGDMFLYIKFTAGKVAGFSLLSFKGV